LKIGRNDERVFCKIRIRKWIIFKISEKEVHMEIVVSEYGGSWIRLGSVEEIIERY